MTGAITVTKEIRFGQAAKGRKILGVPQLVPTAPPTGRVPRVARILALALRLDRLLREGRLAGRGDIAEFGHVTLARVSQIMNLLNLAPDIQEEILFLPRVERGKDPIREQVVRRIASTLDWREQRRMWAELKAPSVR